MASEWQTVNCLKKKSKAPVSTPTPTPTTIFEPNFSFIKVVSKPIWLKNLLFLCY